MAWAVEQDSVCGGCGHLLAESMDIETDGQWIAEKVVCHSCAARDRASEPEPDGKPQYGVYWRTHL